jgi:hypothetical protein
MRQIHLDTVHLLRDDVHYERIEPSAPLVTVWNRCQDAKLVRFTLLADGYRLQIEIADADSTELDGKFTEAEDL